MYKNIIKTYDFCDRKYTMSFSNRLIDAPMEVKKSTFHLKKTFFHLFQIWGGMSWTNTLWS